MALSALIAMAASAAALLILFGMRRLRGLQARLAQGGAAPLMGAAICGMHDTGMAAAGFPVGALTGVPHQARFDDRLQQALAQAARHAGRRLAVLFIDLDGCKPVNAPWGHALGDPLPRQAALHMRARCRSTDALAPATYAAKRAGATGSSASTQACRQAAAWRDPGRRVQVAVNISALQVRQRDFFERVAARIERQGIDPSQLVCGFTESVAMDEVQRTQQVVDGLAAMGVHTASDDFGTGHSSLAMLRQLGAHEPTIDRLFVRDVAGDTKARGAVQAVVQAVVQAGVQLAHALGKTVVAEGVETLAPRDALVALGCDGLQGFCFARPMPPEELFDKQAAEPVPFAASAFLGAPA